MTERKRKLAAIVFTDIVGYTAIMHVDEERGRAIREKHREIFQKYTLRYHGEIIQYYGDGTLSVFESTTDAVESSVEMQRALRQDPEVPVRIGIHTGDIYYDEEEVFGDGVNIASRLESACVPGSILISSKVYDDIRNHTWLEADPLGEFSLKNISEPIRLFAIKHEGLAMPRPDQWLQAINRAEKVQRTNQPSIFRKKVRSFNWNKYLIPIIAIMLLAAVGIFQWVRSPNDVRIAQGNVLGINSDLAIAVLPFKNLSDDPSNEYFSDGITEDILSLLAQVKEFNVVSRTSVMKYKDTDKSIREIGRELKVDKILEGSVRRQDNKVRIVAQLIDAKTDNHIWAKTYDREITEIFEVQSEVAQSISDALKVTLTQSEKEKLTEKPTTDIAAYDLYLKGREYYFQYTKEDNELAIQLFHKALQRDPYFSLAYAGLGDALAQKAYRFSTQHEYLDSAEAYSQRAILLNPKLSEGFKSLGLVYHYRGQYDEALAAYKDALDRNPNNEMACVNISSIHLARGNMKEAVQWARRAMKLMPNDKWATETLAKMYMQLGMFDEAKEVMNNCLQFYPDFSGGYSLLATIHMIEGNYEKAMQLADQNNEFSEKKSVGFLIKGAVLLEQGDYRKAKAYLEQSGAIASKSQPTEIMWEGALNYTWVLKQLEDPAWKKEVEKLEEKLGDFETHFLNADYYYLKSMIEAIKGNKEESLIALEASIEKGLFNYHGLHSNVIYQDLRSTSRFQQLEQELKKRMEQARKEVEDIES